jgi:hypothetical protein
VSNRGIRAGSVVDATDWAMPARQTGYGNGANTVTASAFAALPTNTASCSITNPHPFAKLLVLVEYGAWMIGNTGTGQIYACPVVSGSITVTAGIGGGGPIGWGEVLYETATSYHQHRASCPYELPASATAATFELQAYRNGSGTVKCDFPLIRVTPLRYVYDEGRTTA